MSYILNSLEDIKKVYTPNIEYLIDDFIPYLSEFNMSLKVINESLRFNLILSDNNGDEAYSAELTLEAILTGIKYNLISKNHNKLIHNIDYEYLLNNIDLEIFKSELNKSLVKQEKSFIKEIEDKLENSNSDLKFNRYFKINIENLIESKNYLKSLISNQNDFIKLVINEYVESYSKTYNQLKKEYFDLLPKYFEIKQIDFIDNRSDEKNPQKINSIELLLKYINDYSIFSLYSLEPILEGQIVTVTLDTPVFDKELDCTYTIDEIKLSLSRFNFLERKENNYDDNDYYHYAHELSDDIKTWSLQKLNYEDFITYKNDFVAVVNQKLEDIENEILKLIPVFITKNIAEIENIKHLINYMVIKKWEEDNLSLLNRFHEDEYTIVSYKNIKKNGQITEVMNIVYERKESFIDKIKKEFSFYYVKEFHETEFSRSLKKLDIDFKTDLTLKSESRATSVTEILLEPIRKLTDCGFYKVLQAKYPEEENQQSIIATIFRIHLKSANIKYDIITVGTQYYNFCFVIGLISHLEKEEFKSGVEIAILLNDFSTNDDENLSEMKVKSFENNHTNKEKPNSQYYPFTDSSNKKINTILMKLKLIH